jgi:CubicO group peptidase (beta-lactamase class C family)
MAGMRGANETFSIDAIVNDLKANNTVWSHRIKGSGFLFRFWNHSRTCILEKRLIMRNWLYLALLLFPCLVPAQTGQLEDFITNKMEEAHIPGLAAAIVKESGICWEGYFGTANFDENRQVDSSTIFMLASVSKTVTGTAVLHLHEQGYFELDDDINDYISFDVHVPQHPQTPITFRQLLTHRAAIRDNWDLMPYFPGDSPISLHSFLYNYLDPSGADYDPSQNFYNQAPGTAEDYSNVGYALLGYLVEKIADQDFNEYCNTQLFDPLEMNDTRWFLSETDQSRLAMPYYFSNNDYVSIGHYGYTDYPDGQLRSTARDLANYLLMYIQGGQSTLFPATIQLLTPTDFSDGLTWWNNDYNLPGYQIWGHDGGDQGVTTVIGFNPVDSIGVIILTNGEGDLFSTDLWEEIWTYARSEDCEAPTIISGIQELSNEASLKVSPNPNSGDFLIQWKGERLELFTTNGVLMYSEERKTTENTSEINALPTGVYWARTISGSSGSVRKVIVE